MSVIEINNSNFESEVLRSEKPVLADFNASWCGPCRMLKPMLDQLAGERNDVKFVSINIDDEYDLAEQYGVSSIPCLVLFKGGQEAGRSVGLIPKAAIENFLES